MMTDAKEARRRIRLSHHLGHTAGLAPGALQVNLVILPSVYADDFEAYCRANLQACPLIAKTEPGQTVWPDLGADIDIRCDVPAYNVYQGGTLTATCLDLVDWWRNDLVSFALGCSFTFEHALLRSGIPVRNIEAGTTVPMFKTKIETTPSGPFGGPLVVSMRPVPTDRVDDAIRITSRYPLAHGAPVHVGDPGALGIVDLTSPDWGAASHINQNEVPVFWACGVTPQAALERAQMPLCITHCPGHMLVTDLPEYGPFLVRNTR